ncbi:MAG: cyclase family protein [Spirochaetia bacterium]|jgi:kynurenine formamidase
MRVYYDLSHPFDENTYHPFGFASFRNIQMFPSHGCRHAIVTMSLHFATHMDAPWHMVEEGRRLDEIPLNDLIGEALVLDVSGKYGPDGKGPREIARTDLRHALEAQRQELRAGDALIVHTGWSPLFSSDPSRYYDEYRVLSGEACEWLVQEKIRLVGIDAPDVDLPACYQERPFHPENHRRLLSDDIFIIENVGGQVADLSGRRVTLIPAPMKVAGEYASGAPVRLLAVAEG